ncbi:MAG TPA: hypothetical protein VGJ84_05540 [Polyangiaceae bacterium]
MTCASDKDCASLGQLCDRTNGYCAECLKDVDCPVSSYCDTGKCAAKVCAPQTSLCVRAALLTCDSHGAGYSSVECSNGCSETGGAHCIGGSPGGAGGTGGSAGSSGTAGGGGTGGSRASGGTGGSTGGSVATGGKGGGTGGMGGVTGGSGGAGATGGATGGGGGMGGLVGCMTSSPNCPTPPPATGTPCAYQALLCIYTNCSVSSCTCGSGAGKT